MWAGLAHPQQPISPKLLRMEQIMTKLIDLSMEVSGDMVVFPRVARPIMAMLELEWWGLLKGLVWINPFLALILAGFLVGVLSPVPLDLDEKVAEERHRLSSLLDAGSLSPDEFEALSRTARDRVEEGEFVEVHVDGGLIDGLDGAAAVANTLSSDP